MTNENVVEITSDESDVGPAKNDGLHVYGEGERTFTVDAETYGLTRKAVAMQFAVANRWIAAEPRISAAFGAVKDEFGTPISMACYESGTVEHKALLQFLREVHPLTAKYEGQVLAAKGAKAGGANPETVDDLETRRNLTGNKIKADLANSMRALKDAFIKNKQGEKGDRTLKSPSDILKECALRLGKFADKSGVTAEDKALAAKYKQVLDSMTTGGLDAVWSAIPLAPVAARITKDWTAPSEVRTLTKEEILAEALADAVVG